MSNKIPFYNGGAHEIMISIFVEHLPQYAVLYVYCAITYYIEESLWNKFWSNFRLSFLYNGELNIFCNSIYKIIFEKVIWGDMNLSFVKQICSIFHLCDCMENIQSQFLVFFFWSITSMKLFDLNFKWSFLLFDYI